MVIARLAKCRRTRTTLRIHGWAPTRPLPLLLFSFPLSFSPCLLLSSNTPPCPLQTQQQLHQPGQRGTSANPQWTSSTPAAAPSASLRLILIPIALLYHPQGRWSALATAATSGAWSQWQQLCRLPHNGGISHLQLELLPTQSTWWAAAALEVSCPLSPSFTYSSYSSCFFSFIFSVSSSSYSYSFISSSYKLALQNPRTRASLIHLHLPLSLCLPLHLQKNWTTSCHIMKYLR